MTHVPRADVSVAEDATERLLLDHSKLAWHTERVAQWERGEKIAPITIDMALTRACDASCSFCYAMLQESEERAFLDVPTMARFLEDCAEIGVKAVSFVSDGESVLSPAYVPSIIYGHKLGIDMASGTNGWQLTPEKLDKVLPHLTYLRFNVAAGDPSRYAEIMANDRTKTETFTRAMEHIRYAVAGKKRDNLPVTIGTQMVLMPQDGDQIIPFAKLAVELGVDYGVIKHCSDDEKGSLGVDYTKYPALYDVLKQAESLGTPDTQIHVKWSKIKEGPARTYARCYGAPFILQISGSGLVAPCGMLFGSKYGKFHIGDITKERFKDIWNSDRYWQVMEYLASPKFDARWACGALCLQHKTNQALDAHVKGHRISKAQGRSPAHVNFI